MSHADDSIVHVVAGSAIQLSTSAAREDPDEDYSREEQLFSMIAFKIRHGRLSSRDGSNGGVSKG
jgi:hypothetical protein